MRKLAVIVFLALGLLTSVSVNVQAAVRDSEIQSYIGDFGWTLADLRHYLSLHNRTLADFATVEELKQWLGPPVTEEGLERLLQRYQLTKEELEVLLGQFGETVQDYVLMNDLDTAIRFYLRSYEKMQRVHDMLSSMEFTEEEAKRFFDHVRSLHANDVNELKALNVRLAQIRADNTEAVATVWQQLLNALRLQADIYLVTTGQMKPVSARELMMRKPLTEDVWIALSDEDGARIIDLRLPKHTNAANVIVQAEKELLTAGQIAYDMKGTLYGQKMANTASPYAVNMALGLLLIVAGLFFYKQKRVVR